jgi:catechol 2,3-dioxygenase-like lactoylglutathione lyase family enzyme
MPALLEHTNFTVADPHKTAAWMEALFGWKIRWQGDSLGGGLSIHVGTEDQYLALYTPRAPMDAKTNTYTHVGGLNHIAVVVDDIDATEAAVIAHGFKTGNHADYEPGRRFYFHDDDDIEYEVVQYD